MIEVIHPGFYTSIQDQGRMGFRHLGIPISGAMDNRAFDLAHLLMGETANTTLIECTLVGPILRFDASCSLVMTGAQMEAFLNETPIKNNEVVTVNSGDILKLRQVLNGIRTYLKINHYLMIPEVLGSTSFYQPITSEALLKKGTHIFWSKSKTSFQSKNSRIRINDDYLFSDELEVERGPEYELFKDSLMESLTSSKFEIISQNRMGYRIKTSLKSKSKAMLSCAVRPGTVQMTPSGTLLIVGMDGQVSGGYPRIFQLSDDALSILVQKKAGDKISFKLLDKPLQRAL
jgi:biotin-dependent carboxylase-like uncharacterized protein